MYRDSKRKSGIYFRQCKYEWLEIYETFTYSTEMDGLFCLACVLFPVQCATTPRAQLLINKPYNNWKDAHSDLQKHSLLKYHQDATAKMNNFLQCMKLGKDIGTSLNHLTQERMHKKRLFLSSIVKSLMFCGRQGIALRSHMDNNSEKDKDEVANMGNFKALLEFRCDSGDTELAAHLATCSRNAQYTSNTI